MMKWMMWIAALLTAGQVFAAELTLPSIFADHMVLQRGQAVPVWGTAEPGAAVAVKFAGQEKSTTADADGKWRVDLEALKASAEPRMLEVSASRQSAIENRQFNDVLVGEVWFAGGQSNMYRPFRMLTHPANDPFYEPIAEYLRNERDTANDPLFRQYRVGKIYTPFEENTQGRGGWSKAVPGEVNEFCATAYFFCRELRRELDVPVAMISCNLGGTRIEPWIPPAAFQQDEILKKDYEQETASLKKRIADWDEAAERAAYQQALAKWENGGKRGKGPRKPEHPKNDKQAYGTLYNGMIRPLIPYAVRGALWYQGESNSNNFPDQYDLRLAAMIEGWRTAWGQEKLPVYWCQLANYKEPNKEPVDEAEGWVLVQNAMRRALRIPDTGMAVLNDIGEAGDIHPKNKIDAGKRLSRWALNDVYGKACVVSGPLYKDAVFSGSKVIISFDHAGSGLMVGHKHLMDPAAEVDEPLQRFQICGADGEWKWAEAEIVGKDRVEVKHPEIRKPVEVRYAWSPNPEGANLYNREGLPASVFTTAE